ncbi:Uncharacterised protein [Mycobacteroides abscessus subsp. abscessus]|nr:Uncharacterised protein [Mycobacteroides abscessus subsp. abscessus]
MSSQAEGADLTPEQVADRVAMLAHRRRASHDGALARMRAALPGWVGESQSALADLIESLQRENDRTHAQAMRTAETIRKIPRDGSS